MLASSLDRIAKFVDFQFYIICVSFSLYLSLYIYITHKSDYEIDLKDLCPNRELGGFCFTKNSDPEIDLVTKSN